MAIRCPTAACWLGRVCPDGSGICEMEADGCRPYIYSRSPTEPKLKEGKTNPVIGHHRLASGVGLLHLRLVRGLAVNGRLLAVCVDGASHPSVCVIHTPRAIVDRRAMAFDRRPRRPGRRVVRIVTTGRWIASKACLRDLNRCAIW